MNCSLETIVRTNVLQLLNQQGLSIRQMALDLNCDPTHLSRVINGKRTLFYIMFFSLQSIFMCLQSSYCSPLKRNIVSPMSKMSKSLCAFRIMTPINAFASSCMIYPCCNDE